MSITTLDGVLAGMRPPEDIMKIATLNEGAGIHNSLFYAVGRPGAAIAPSPGIAGAALTSYAGQIPWSNPVSGNSYLAKFQMNTSSSGTVKLLDRLWHNSGIVAATITAQTVNSVAWPARDNNASINGAGIMIALEVSTATTNAGAFSNTTLSYTASDGTAGKTATLSSFPATATQGTFLPFSLANGDVGVRSIQSITLGTSLVTGTVHLVAYRILGSVDIALANIGNSIDAVTGGFVQLYDNTVPFLVQIPSTALATNFFGQLIISQG